MSSAPTPAEPRPSRPYAKWAVQFAVAVLIALAARYGISVPPAPLPANQTLPEPVPQPHPIGEVLHYCSNVAPSIEGETKVERDRLVRLKAVGVTPKAGLIWRVSPSEGVDKATTTRGVFEFCAPPGTYDVDLIVIDRDENDGFLISESRVRVVIGDAEPPPKPAPKSDPVAATCRIQFDRAGCTATVVWPRRPDGRWDVLTAAHCTEQGVGAKGRMSLRDGRVVPVTVTVRDTTSDVCWLVTDQAVESLPFAELFDEVAEPGTKVWHNGYGVDRPSNREDGVVTGLTNESQLRMTLNVSSGDSGGGIFRVEDGKVVATVCCTTKRGAQVTMYGGHSVRAAQLRPKDGKSDDFGFTPVPLPECGGGHHRSGLLYPIMIFGSFAGAANVIGGDPISVR